MLYIASLPSKQALEKEVLGPDNAVDGLVRSVTYGTNRVALWGSFGLTLEAF